jgi:hypothetical protein
MERAIQAGGELGEFGRHVRAANKTGFAMLLVSVLLGALAIHQTVVSFAEPPAVSASSSSESTTALGTAALNTVGLNTAATSRTPFAWTPKVQARPWKSIVLHHSATSGGSVAAIDTVHRRQRDAQGNAWLGIGYHFVIGNGQGMPDGEVQATFRWRDQLAGAHAGEKNHNESGIGICLIGNFDEAAPTPRQATAAAELVRSLAGQYAIDSQHIIRHQDFQATRCPGRLFPWQQVVAAMSATSETTKSVVR